MTEFNFVSEIGGVDTSDLTVEFDANQQIQILSSIFGEGNSDGGLVMPNNRELQIVAGKWKQVGYKISQMNFDDIDRPTLLCPPNIESMVLLAEDTETTSTNIELAGFLQTAVAKILVQGKHCMREVVRDEKIPYAPRPTKHITNASKELASRITLMQLWSAADEDEWSESEIETLHDLILTLLGPGLNDIELRTSLEPLAELGWTSPPMEDLCARIGSRIYEVLVH